MKHFVTDWLLGIVVAVGLFVFYKTHIKLPITSVILTGLIIFGVGFILFLFFKRGTLLRKLAGIAAITGGLLTFGVFVMVFSVLSRM